MATSEVYACLKATYRAIYTTARQVLSLNKAMTQLLQARVIGYDQWQVAANSGMVSVGNQILPASIIPYYSVHGVGGQLNYILPVKNLSLFFKYEHEYKASSHTLGNTVVFGGGWTLPIPKPQPQKN